jgi:hypothetical protein
VSGARARCPRNNMTHPAGVFLSSNAGLAN